MQPYIALAGNPNSGKTTAFNVYTGARQRVGNYPGVTVERKEGTAHHEGSTVHIVDLPGTYSLTAYSEEELVVRRELAERPPQAVINMLDASALERSLYLTVQLLEMGQPLVLALNMIDEARAAGIRIDRHELGQRLGVPVVETVARNGTGLAEALSAALAVEKNREKEGLTISYGSDIDPVLADMQVQIEKAGVATHKYPARWLALKILEGDADVLAEVRKVDSTLAERLAVSCHTVAGHIQKTLKTSPEAVISDYRHGFVRGLLKDGVMTQEDGRDRLAFSDKIDKVLVNAFSGPLIMFAVLYMVFYLTFEVGAYPQGWVEDFFGWLGGIATDAIPPGLLQSLIVSGIIDGLGGILSFVPLILIMFLFIAFLEDTGYMARIAYMVDRIFRSFGLHGSSVMAYITAGGIAGGCAIPGAMATRTLRSPKEKLATLLTLPYFPCGAKLPVFLLLAGVFFPDNEATVMMLMLLAGWSFALLVAWLLRSTIIRGKSTPFVMELPPYRLPTLVSLLVHCWERGWMYIKKAGTVLLAASILIWASMTFPQLDTEKAAPLEAAITDAESALEALAADAPDTLRTEVQANVDTARAILADASLRHSIAGRIGLALEPFTRPIGFDWRTDVALVSGIAAKEAIVSTLGTAYSLGEVDPEESEPLAARLASEPGWSPATALSLMLFVLLYSPCFVALVVIRNEAGGWRWLVFSIVFNTALAYAVSLLAYSVGKSIWS
ncbi:MAG: ferrous iron transport protein B [Desulfovibrio sp.]|nr:ferrous iron transport protein B [Desulfovibrio sp.]MBQ4568423.1 ferrous iron transport protein B [Desulfovibrio sp.]